MSFGPSSTTQSGFNTLKSNNLAASGAAPPLVADASGNLSAGANFFKTLLQGNQANTSALLQPDINRINAANQQTLQAVNTLTPRGGGRSSTLFALPFQGNQQIQSLFNQARTGAASALPQIGSQQGQLGSNLFNISNTGASDLARLGITQQELTNKLWGGLGQGLFGLATLPLGGAGGLAGTLLGKIPGVGA